MPSQRLLYKTVSITETRAREIWEGRIRQQLIDLQEAIVELQASVSAPLPKTEGLFVAVNEGEPGYEEAVYAVSCDAHPLRFEPDGQGGYKVKQ